MRIHASVTGYYDWAPVPPGTDIHEDDLTALRVKQMSDDKWHMRIQVDRETDHAVGIPEEAICRRLAALEKLGRRPSREDAIVETLRKTWDHHFDLEHLVEIDVQDDGPDADIYAEQLAAAGVTDPDKIAAAQKRYADTTDLETYLNVVFKTKSTRRGA